MNEKQAREIVYARSEGVCEVCSQARATNWHHRQNRGRGKVGAWCPSNGLHICGSGTTGCHGDITTHPAWAREFGWSVPSWGDPAATPALIARWGWVFLSPTGDFTPTERGAA